MLQNKQQSAEMYVPLSKYQDWSATKSCMSWRMFSITPSSSMTDDIDRGARGSPKLCHVSYEGTIRVVPDSMMDMAYNLAVGKSTVYKNIYETYLSSFNPAHTRLGCSRYIVLIYLTTTSGYQPSSRISFSTCLFRPQVDRYSVS